MKYHVMLCYVMSCHVMSCYVMSCHVMSCHIMSCYVMLCHVMLCHVMSCYVMLCHVMSCYVMSCHVMLCHVMSCHVIDRLENKITIHFVDVGKCYDEFKFQSVQCSAVHNHEVLMPRHKPNNSSTKMKRKGTLLALSMYGLFLDKATWILAGPQGMKLTNFRSLIL